MILCANNINAQTVHAEPEKHGVCERFIRTVDNTFDGKVRGEQWLCLDELNAYVEVWLAERYHHTCKRTQGEKP
jgi:hypothetical protein